MIERIKEKYKILPKKMEFIEQLANELEKNPRGLQSNWFSGFWSIPKKYQEKVLTRIENILDDGKY